MTAPVDLTQPGYRTLLLGMKGSRAYAFRVRVTTAAGTCTSTDYMLMTGAVPSTIPTATVTIMDAARHARGFIVTTSTSSNRRMAYIIDTDGAPVWWASFPGIPSRAHMSWDGKDMYTLEQNNNNVGGNVARISMEGTNAESNLSGLDTAHHDFTSIPGGIAALVWRGGAPSSNPTTSLVERSTDGPLTTVVADLSTVYNATVSHTNAIHYYPWDDSYTIGDRNPSMFVKLTRQGQLVWQFGGSNPKDASKFIQGVSTWRVNHGHHLLADGTFVFFNNSPRSIALLFKLDVVNLTATSLLSYEAMGDSPFLGDTQFLPNGNILVTYSDQGLIHQITPSGQLVAMVRGGSTLGYTEFRESLYGPPPY